MHRNIFIAFALFTCGLLVLGPSLEAQSRRERHEAAVRESEKPRSVTGGKEFVVATPYGDVYSAILTYLKKHEYTIDSADRDVGQIFTSIEVKGKWRQTGTRLQITLIEEDDEETTVRVAITRQKRYKAVKTEPWSEPQVDEEASRKAAAALRNALVQESES